MRESLLKTYRRTTRALLSLGGARMPALLAPSALGSGWMLTDLRLPLQQP